MVEGAGRGVDLVVIALPERAELVDEGFVPSSAQQINIAGLELGRKRFSPRIFGAGLTLCRYSITGILADDTGGLVFAGLSRILRNNDVAEATIDGGGVLDGSADSGAGIAETDHILDVEFSVERGHLRANGPVRI